MIAPGLPTPYTEQVLDLVAAVPAGCALSYGDVARLVGQGGPRQVGTALARFGGGVPWWRVVRADGSPAVALASEALTRLQAEGTPLTRDQSRVDLARARWRPDATEVSDPAAEMDA